MVTIYFSGTGNTEYIAKNFSEKMNCDYVSIEENVDFEKLLNNTSEIAVCYPIHDFRMPLIMRKFLAKYSTCFKNKKIIIFCTQLLVSGDGARSFVDIFPNNYFDVIYAEHFFMPNNISNLFIFKVRNGNDNKKCIEKANKKLAEACDNIKNNIVKKRGFGILSKILGGTVGNIAINIENYAVNSVKINNTCINCKLCVSICPVNNLKSVNNSIIPNGQCTMCYRCVNKCPKKAITTFVPTKVINQYKGIVVD